MGGRPEVLEPDPGEFFRLKGTGAPPIGVGGVTWRGFGIGTGPDEESGWRIQTCEKYET